MNKKRMLKIVVIICMMISQPGVISTKPICAKASNPETFMVEPGDTEETYAKMAKHLDGGFHLAINNLHFLFTEEYGIEAERLLHYHILDEKNSIVMGIDENGEELANGESPRLQAVYGDGKYSLGHFSHIPIKDHKYYTLEVFNVKGEKWVLRFFTVFEPY